jgi:hypothetical protein
MDSVSSVMGVAHLKKISPDHIRFKLFSVYIE